jgi:hypothetical protein
MAGILVLGNVAAVGVIILAMRPVHFPMIPCMTFAELEKTRFTATVESRMHDKWNAPIDNLTRKPVPGSQPTEYVTIHLIRVDGKALCVCQENPSSNQVAFTSSLQDGVSYTFPDVFVEWQQKTLR